MQIVESCTLDSPPNELVIKFGFKREIQCKVNNGIKIQLGCELNHSLSPFLVFWGSLLLPSGVTFEHIDKVSFLESEWREIIISHVGLGSPHDVPVVLLLMHFEKVSSNRAAKRLSFRVLENMLLILWSTHFILVPEEGSSVGGDLRRKDGLS